MSAEPVRGDAAGASRASRGGGSGGTSGGMDARVARLEAHVETPRSDVAEIRIALTALIEKVAVLTERMAHLPTKGFVVAATGTSLALLSALILFVEKLRALIGV